MNRERVSKRVRSGLVGGHAERGSSVVMTHAIPRQFNRGRILTEAGLSINSLPRAWKKIRVYVQACSGDAN